MVGTAFLGAGAVPSLFAQLVFADECGLASLLFCIVGGGASERANGHRQDESAGSRAKRVCNNVFRQGGVQSQGPPKLCTLVLSLLVCRVGTCRQGQPGQKASLRCRPQHVQQAFGWHSVLCHGEHLITCVLGCTVCTYILKRGSSAVATFYYPRIVQPRGRFPSFH
jgi:hypothetical protein